MPISLPKNEGRIAPNNTLLVPAFYMVEEIEDWLKGTVKAWMAERLHWTE